MEILAPAGGKESFFAAINSGANAVYMGLNEFSARKNAENFSLTDLKYYLDYAHTFGVKVYITANTLVKDAELNDFLSMIKSAYCLGADAFIIQDMLLGPTIKSICPSIVLHLSTQGGVCNVSGASLAKEYGFSRVILARETPIADIKQISKIIETECFVQGALCSSFSGHCYFSSFVGGNSGNRGLCKQPCRKLYSLNGRKPDYAISLSDLCVGEDITKLKDVGVSSLKIEGRMRSAEYVAASVSYYKSIIKKRGDLPERLSDLKRTFNRGNYTKGYYFGLDKSILSPDIQSHMGEHIGKIQSVTRTTVEVITNHKYNPNDGYKIIRDGKEVGSLSVKRAKALTYGFVCDYSGKPNIGDSVYITKDASLGVKLLSNVRKKKVDVSVTVEVGKNVVAFIDGKSYESDFIVERGNNSVITKEQLEACFNKTADYPFEVRLSSKIIGDCFVPSSLINAFRRSVYSDVFSKCTITQNDSKDITISTIFTSDITHEKTACITRDLSVKSDILIYVLDDYNAPIDIARIYELRKNHTAVYLYLPAYFTFFDKRIVQKYIKEFDGIYADGYYGISLKSEFNCKLFLGLDANIFNSVALKEAEKTADYIALSKELSINELKPLLRDNTFVFCSGDISLMDLVYCPFNRNCAKCEQKPYYKLNDGERAFTIRRYKLSSCRFEIYNCVPLSFVPDFSCNKLASLVCETDNSVLGNPFSLRSGATKGNLIRGVN